jgi:hypothetical protein
VWFVVGGTAPGRALSGPLHAYVGPLGAVLAVIAIAASWAVWQGLGRLAELSRRLRRASSSGGDGTPASVPDWCDSASAGPRPGPLRIGVALASVQLLVYLCQENLEARLVGMTPPGLHALTAHHCAPLAIHLALALIATAVTVEILDRWRARSDELTRVVVRCRALAARRAEPALAPSPRPDLRPPVLRHGRSLLGRAPPLLAA